MRKKVYIDEKAEEELKEFSLEIKEAFEKRFVVLSIKGYLEYPEARKVTRDLFEIRIKLRGIYRGFYAYVGKKYIVVLHIIRKKTQKTPKRSLEVAERRLRQYG